MWAHTHTASILQDKLTAEESAKHAQKLLPHTQPFIFSLSYEILITERSFLSSQYDPSCSRAQLNCISWHLQSTITYLLQPFYPVTTRDKGKQVLPLQMQLMIFSHSKYWNTCIRSADVDSVCSCLRQLRTVIATQSCRELHSTVHSHPQVATRGRQWTEIQQGLYQALISVDAHSRTTGVMTAQSVSVAQQMAMLFWENWNRNLLFSLSFRISSPPEISCFLVFIILQKNIKDAAIYWEIKYQINHTKNCFQ